MRKKKNDAAVWASCDCDACLQHAHEWRVLMRRADLAALLAPANRLINRTLGYTTVFAEMLQVLKGLLKEVQ